MRALVVLLLVATTSMATIYGTPNLTNETSQVTTIRFIKSLAEIVAARKDGNDGKVKYIWDLTTGDMEEVSLQTYRETQCILLKLVVLLVFLFVAGTTIYILCKIVLVYWKVQLVREMNDRTRQGYAPISVIKLNEYRAHC